MKIRTMIAAYGLAASAAVGQCVNPVWSPEFGTPGTGLQSSGSSMVVFDPDGPGPLPEELYVAGYFASAGGTPGTRGIARWNGNRWATVGGGVGGTGSIIAMTTFDPDGAGPGRPRLAVAGGFTLIGGVVANRVALWDGEHWLAVGQGPPATVGSLTELAEHDPDGSGPGLPRLIVAGIEPGFDPQPEVYQWDGTTWTALPDPGDYFEIRGIASFDEDGPGPAGPSLIISMRHGEGVLRLSGSQWESVGGGLSVRSGSYRCDVLKVIDEDGPGPGRESLLAGGNFTHAGGVFSPGIARWDGHQWSAIGPGAGAQVEDIAAVDFTSGTGPPVLHAWGNGHLSRFSSQTQAWTLLSTATFFEPAPWQLHTLAAYRSSGETLPSLYLTGVHTDMSNVESNYFARMSCPTCYANCDGSQGMPSLTANDFQCFMTMFAAGDAYANCDGVGGLTGNDFQCYLDRYVSGCP